MLPKGFIVIELADQSSLEDRQYLLDFIRNRIPGAAPHIKSVTPITEIGEPLSDRRIAQIKHTAAVTEHPDLEDLLSERERLMTANALVENHVRAKMKEIQNLDKEVQRLKPQLAQVDSRE